MQQEVSCFLNLEIELMHRSKGGVHTDSSSVCTACPQISSEIELRIFHIYVAIGILSRS